MNCPITAYPVRIIPFDLGRQLTSDDIKCIEKQLQLKYKQQEISPRQSSILKGIAQIYKVSDDITVYLYSTGICVFTVAEDAIFFADDYKSFAVSYGKNRKNAHKAFFEWEHRSSASIWEIVTILKKIVRDNTPRKATLRKSASVFFENKGLSYVMTLSMFNLSSEIIKTSSFKNYPDWLKNNIFALLDPALLFLEDSSKFESTVDADFDLKKALSELDITEEPTDYERHRHINTYMSWAAVTIFGQLQEADKEEYITLEIQLQSDWFYIYCLDKSLEDMKKPKRKDVVDIQRHHYEIDLLENRLLDFDDSSMPARVLDIQKGLVETSGLDGSIQHLQRKMQYILEREQLDSALKQKHLGQSSEILLFIIAYIEIAPTVAEYCNRIYANAGIFANVVIVILGIILLMIKN